VPLRRFAGKRTVKNDSQSQPSIANLRQLVLCIDALDALRLHGLEQADGHIAIGARFCVPKRDETLLEAGRRLAKLKG
jgi:hypothetical protein